MHQLILVLDPIGPCKAKWTCIYLWHTSIVVLKSIISKYNTSVFICLFYLLDALLPGKREGRAQFSVGTCLLQWNTPQIELVRLIPNYSVLYIDIIVQVQAEPGNESILWDVCLLWQVLRVVQLKRVPGGYEHFCEARILFYYE